MSIINPQDYSLWLKEIKSRVESTQTKAIFAVNRELIYFYWEVGRMITEKQATSSWGDKVVVKLSRDLRHAFPDVMGLSASTKTARGFGRLLTEFVATKSAEPTQSAY